MAQHDYNIANQSGLEFRQDLNNALSAIVTQNAGATEPTVSFPGMEWLDTTSNPPVKKRRNQANTAWENILTEAGRLVSGAADAATQRVALGISLPAAFNSSSVASGTADALTGAFTPAITSLPSSPNTLLVYVQAISANTTSTPTFKADSTTAKTIVKGVNQPLVPGDISGSGHLLTLQYDPLLDKWILQNPASVVVKSNRYQIGVSTIATQNFTLTAEAQDGTMKLARGDAGATTQDIFTVDINGRMSATQGGPTLKTTASAPYSPAAGELLTRPHGLAFTPSSAKLVLECVVADAGYSVGERIHMQHQWTGAALLPISTYVDSTNCAAKLNASYSSCIYTKSTGAFVSPTANAWKYYFEVTA